MAKQETKKELAPARPAWDLALWQKDAERMLEDFLGRRLSWGGMWPRAMDMAAPAVDLYEEKDEVVAKAELPGMEKKDIQVNISDHHLTIQGEKKKEEETKDKNFYRSERSYGSVFRSIELPAEVAIDKAKASFKDGVLEIRLPKTQEAKKKSTQVKID
jgi:HSP20 family protein